MDNIYNLTNKRILVTGACGGIGNSLCRLLDNCGASLYMLGTSHEKLQALQATIKGSHTTLAIDLSDTGCIESRLKPFIKEHGILDGIVHCAGVSSRKPLGGVKRSAFETLMNINFYSFVELVRVLSKRTLMNEGSSIVAMSSISSIKGYKAKTEYCVSKAAIDAFVRCMALELADKKIRINSIQAGEVLTPMALRARNLNNAIGAADFIAPLGASEPSEIAHAIAFLLSDSAKTITGTSIVIDGGATV